MKKCVAVGISLLFLVSIVPFIHGEPNDVIDEFAVNEDSYQYAMDWSVHLTNQSIDEESSRPVYYSQESTDDAGPSPLSGPMDSAWPTLSHDMQHTGRSPYPTTANPGAELWRIRGSYPGVVWSSPVIDQNNIIYFGTIGGDSALYALYQNGSIKWRYQAKGLIWCTPAIEEDGTFYFTTWGAYHYFYALNSNGTAKWLFAPGDSSTSSPAIADDGTIYFGSDDYFIYAINPNGTEKWRYITGFYVNGAPAIGQDGTIYIGSGDHYLYALHPNGTLRWRFTTGGEIKGSASIAPDGTIYVPSFDGYLYALYPNGTMKWQVPTGGSIAAAGVALAEDGTIYVGTEQLWAFHPNGSLKWTTNVQGSIYGTVPAVSADGTIFVSAGGSLVAVNPDGTEKWRKQLTIAQIHSSPCIGPDDRVYVGSEDYWGMAYGYLHAFGLGQPKNITIEQPRRNHWYLFSKDMGKTMTDNLVIVGSVTVKVNASIEHEIDRIDFYIAHFRDVEPEYQIQYTDTEAPYEWTMNKRYGNDVFPALPFDRLSIKVIGWYKGGCTWSEEITNFWYFHLKK